MTASSPPPDPVAPSRAAQAAALQLLGQAPPSERADAARNRARLLQAAATLIQEQGAEHLTMDAVAAAAGVGKGTVFRRFGDRSGLLFALLDETELTFQNAFMLGPPPLGPGAGPIARLEAFGTARLRHLLDNLNLYLEADQQATARYTSPSRNVRARHIAILLHEADVRGDLDLLAETLLGTLDPTFVHHLLARRGHDADQLEAGWRDLVARITHPAITREAAHVR
ncbi:TetR/AcrR family transcriptional regulator [Actinospica sp. MGRD01-02]|uniref:TetR/AcrR family transcriptional regulator n=1 Tax=Actinospica acidithermotolerans TaxID=2828514 RepID=A0A941EDB3_9ACTN|nr:TetR/AcrR family transcriptional regulator [Actinospica acidithermotolerans]MBR7828310.1 TetR/AcrR family transcriptional regulator [Actinospica acidithermotolerans]